jgi:hypothetical protein
MKKIEKVLQVCANTNERNFDEKSIIVWQYQARAFFEI